MIEVDDADSASLATALPTPPDLADATVAGIRSPASGLRAMKSTNSNRPSSVHSAPAWRMNTAVSASVIGRVRIRAIYANGNLYSRRQPRSAAASFMIHVAHAAAAIASGLCETVLITHGESGRSGVGRNPQCRRADQPRRPVRAALRADGAADLVHDPGPALHKDLWPDARAIGDGLGRASANGRPRTRAPPFKAPITVEDVLNSRMIAYPFGYCSAAW